MRVVAAAVGVALATAGAAAALDRTTFRYTRELASAGTARPTSFEPDGALFAHARPGFADLRVLDSRGRETPWRVVPRPERTPPTQLRLLNRGRRGGKAVALVDLGRGRRIHDRLELEVPDKDFVGRVQVYGSDDRRRFTRLSTTVIYDVAGAAHARSTTALYPPSDFRYIELRATGVRAITGATISGALREETLRRPFRAVERREAGRRTVLRADLGFRNLPVDRLELTAAGRYDRGVTIEGSNNGTTWAGLAQGRIARYPDPTPISALELGGRHRYLRVTIENGDDEPLTPIELRAFARSRRLLVADGFKPPFRLLYGSPRLAMPVYDYERLPRRALGAERGGSLRPERLNRPFEPPADTRSFAARHPGALQAALVVAALVVGLGGLLALRRRT